MKAYYLIGVIAVCAFADACQPALDINGGARSSRYVKTDYKGEDPEGNPSQKEDPALKLDTAVYFSAVEFPLGYDWKKDSACGNSTATLRLYRNFKPYADFTTGEATCISTDPDTHHWIDGNLYTEYNLYGATVISKNGRELFRYEGQEFLKGLLILGEDVWTLGQNCKGKGFSLRCNGEVLLTSKEGIIFGDLTSSVHEGLYADSDKICFCYLREGVLTNNLYKVVDVKEQLFASNSRPVLDMAILDGTVSMVYTTDESTVYEKDGNVSKVGTVAECAWLCAAEYGPSVCFSLKRGQEQEFLVWGNGSSKTLGRCRQTYVYPQTDGTFKYVKFTDQGMVLCDIAKGGMANFSKPAVFSRSCIKFIGDSFFLARNAQEGIVSIETRQRSVPVEVNGYVSALDVRLEKAQEE